MYRRPDTNSEPDPHVNSDSFSYANAHTNTYV
jgi:hypothetical protein